MAPCLPDVISKTQSAFVKGRSIGDNILMAHELVNGYHQKHISPRCAIKIDLRKAFDSVNLSYVLNTMLAMGFPEKFVDWIRGCLSSVMLSAGVNGGSVGYFQGVKGLRQGDPLSPGLFVISMEGLHCFISRVVEMKKIPFHPMCKKGIRQAIYDQTGFTEGKLPVWYLGVPLVSGKIKSKDCEVLIAKITSKIRGWNVRTLSYAGRLQLVKSVLSTMSQFWMAIFLLPKSIIKAVEKICNDFLWKVSEGERKKAKVAWPKLTFLKSEGRLDIKDLSIWNISCVIRHIWSILAAAGSIWVAWINLYRLKKVLFGIA
ncbi:Putative ribonuclease H protein At1g65750 [Linum perenne]